MNHGINFGHNRKWSAHSDLGLMDEAKNEALPQIMRINSLAKARVNRNGHAEFGPGEIAFFLGINLRQNVTKLINKAIAAGLFMEGSGQRCILVSGLVVQRNTGSGSCNHHNINKSGKEIIEELEELVNYETGEIIEDESPVSPSEELVVSEEPVVISVPENPIVGQDEVPESPEEDFVIELLSDEEVQAVIDEDIEFGIEEVKNPMAWFEELDGMEKDVAAFGLMYKKRDGVGRIRAVAHEASLSEYDEWGDNLNMRYTYAGFNVDVPASNNDVTDMMEEAW